MKLFNHIKSVLEQNENFCIDGKIFKNKVVEAALKLDPALLSILLKDEIAKKTFFQEVEGLMIFDKVKFQKFVSNKEFLPDSFTAFKNKIGLTANGEYLTEAKEVVLDFPFKDCVLEGGQTKEDQKRQEIFWNETLAPDEIDRMFEPKVLTNWKRYDKQGTHIPTSITPDANFLFKGNNLLTLHSLLKVYVGKIDLIYIDPPYNTGGANNTFAYNNTFNHSTWLTFMKNRLEVSRKLLTQKGFIAIAIDHYELFHLGVLCDEIFGRDNRVGIVSVIHKPEGRNQEKFFATSNEFMMVYAKDKSITDFTPYILDKEKLADFNETDDKGNYKLNNYLRLGGGDPNLKINKPHFFYPIYVNPEDNSVHIDYHPAFVEVLPITNAGQERTWKTKKETFIKTLESGEIISRKDQYGKYQIYEKYRPDRGQLIKTHWIDPRYNAINQGTKIVNNLVGSNKFSFPKSVELIKDIIKIMTRPDSIVLDFFGGSGTTAHAVLECNAEDGGKRRFIICEQMDYFDEVTVKRNHNVIKHNGYDAEFFSAELYSVNQEIINMVHEINSKEDIINFITRLKNNKLLRYDIHTKSLDFLMEEIENKDIQSFKTDLLHLLDFNQYYLPISEIDDKDFDLSDSIKALNNQFYFS